MKKLIIAAILVFVASAAFATDLPLTLSSAISSGHYDSYFSISEDGRHRGVGVNLKDGFVEVTTENNVLRIYPCGKVEKMTWTQINPNEDKPTNLAGTLYTLPVTDYTTDRNMLEWQSGIIHGVRISGPPPRND